MNMSFASVLVASLLLIGCGGGGEESASPNASTNPVAVPNSEAVPMARSTVIGPLTRVQDTLSNSVMQPLAVASRGTPLAGVVSCTDFAIARDALNIINAVAKGQRSLTQDPRAIADAAPQIQIQILQLSRDLQQMLVALAGGAACSDNAMTMLKDNPLSGTPLAVLGDELLPVLNKILNAPRVEKPPLSDLANQLLAISNAYNMAYRQLPASVVGTKVSDGMPALATRMIEVPVLGGVLSTFNSTLPALAVLIQSADQGDTPWVLSMLEDATRSVIGNLLLNVLPLNNLQAHAGSVALSDPIHRATEQIGMQLRAGMNSSIPDASLQLALGDAMAPVLSTLHQSAGPGGATLLTSLLSRLTAVLSTLPRSEMGNVTVTTLINTVLPAVEGVLLSMVTSSGSTSGSTATANAGCQFNSTGLAVLCMVT